MFERINDIKRLFYVEISLIVIVALHTFCVLNDLVNTTDHIKQSKTALDTVYNDDRLAKKIQLSNFKIIRIYEF